MTQVLFDRLKSNLAQCINDGTIYFVTDSNGNFTQIALGDGSKSHVVGIGPKMDDTTKQDFMSKLGLTISSDMGTIQLGKLSNFNGVSSQKMITYERTGLGTDTHEISTVGYVHQYMKTAQAMVYAGIFNAQTKEITDYNTAIISPSEAGNVTFDYLLNGNEGETLLTSGMSFIVGTAGDLEGYTGISIYGGETKVEMGDMIIIINVQQKEGDEGGSTYNEASILIIQNTNSKISDGAITTAKLADEAVTSSKLSTDIQSLIRNLSKTATFAGIATPTTNPGTPDGPVFYIARGKGTYTNFGGIDVIEDEVVILYYDKEWNKEATGIASHEKLTELKPEIIKVKISTIGYNFLTEAIPAYNNTNFPIVLEEGTKIVNNGIKVLLSYDSTLSDYITLENGKNVVLEKPVGYIQTAGTSGIVNLFISKIAQITTGNLINGAITEEKLSEDVKNRLQSFDEGISSLGENVSNLDNRVEAQLNVITKKMSKISSNNLLNPQSLKSGYINVSGSIFESSTTSYSDYISVDSGNTVYTYTNWVNFRPFAARFITAYDKDKNVLTDKGLNNTTDATEYVVPDGVKYIIVSVNNTYFDNGYGAVSIGNLSTFEPYVEPSFVANRAFIEDALNYIEFTSNSISTKGELNEGDSLTLPRININKSILMSFSCDIDSFGSIEFGKRNSAQTLGRWWKLTSSTIEFWNGGRYIDYTSDVFKTPFSAQNNLQIIVHKSVSCNADNPTLNTKASLTIMSNGNVWELKQAFDYPENNVEMFVKSVDSKLTGCSLSAQPMDIGKNIWLFGDSYMSWDTKRWVYYLASFGYADNCLINAYAGQTTIDQIPVLDTLLKIGKPKYIVWCLGMNDGADNSSPSSNWMNGINHVLEVCNKYGIVPILATIPTVPTINHEEKNLWIRNSGHRYIDFAKAVGSKANGDWYSGMLDDGVHPTETGARALFGQAMADFAELAIKVF